MPSWLEEVFGLVRQEINEWPDWLREQHAVRKESLQLARESSGAPRSSRKGRGFDPDKMPPGVRQPSLMAAVDETKD